MIRTLAREMSIEREAEQEIANATEGTTDVSGSNVLKYQEQMHSLWR